MASSKEQPGGGVTDDYFISVMERSMSMLTDLVRMIEVRDGISRTIWASPSFRTVLGHDPKSMVGDMKKHKHVYTTPFREKLLPMLITTAESGIAPDGRTAQYPFVHHDGHEVRPELPAPPRAGPALSDAARASTRRCGSSTR